jgi:hypothetical protein
MGLRVLKLGGEGYHRERQPDGILANDRAAFLRETLERL